MSRSVHFAAAFVFCGAWTAFGSSPGAAQIRAGSAAVSPNDPVERLGRYIRVLAGAPQNLPALLGAGQAALDVGDANAALGFFARAEDVAPSNGIAKAGLGSSLVAMERPDDALRLFAQAVSLGVPEANIARDRGLAYDLRGDNRLAQRDYAVAMARGGDDELIRRYALSMGISGDRAGALQMLDPLLRKQDQGAWRARAFIMAMTGDVAGANGVARQLMVPAMANAMAPLLSRLATLNPAERAHAVNFGTVPAEGSQMATVQTGDPYLANTPRPATTALASNTGAGSGLVPSGAPLGERPQDVVPSRTAQPVSSAPRRRPDGRVQVATRDPVPTTVLPKSAPTLSATPSITPATPTARMGQRVGERMGPVDPNSVARAMGGAPSTATVTPLTALPPPGGAMPTQALPTQTQATQTQPSQTQPSQSLPSQAIPSGGVPRTAQQSPPVPSDDSNAPAFEVPAISGAKPTPVVPLPSAQTPSTQAPAVSLPLVRSEPAPITAAPTPSPSPAVSGSTAPSPVSPTKITPAQEAAVSRLAGLLAGLQTEQETAADLPSTREIRLARAAARKKMADLAAQAAAEKAAKEAAAAEALAAKKYPARIWVQVATGRNDSGLALTWKRIRGDHEAALKGQSAWSAPFKATNRILVGPMKSAAAARTLVNTLAKDGITATTWSSEAGEEVAKIAAK